MRPHVALGTVAVDGSGPAVARASPARVWLADRIEVPSSNVGNTTAAIANALTNRCVFMIRRPLPVHATPALLHAHRNLHRVAFGIGICRRVDVTARIRPRTNTRQQRPMRTPGPKEGQRE